MGGFIRFDGFRGFAGGNGVLPTLVPRNYVMNSVQQFRRVVGKTDHRQLIGFRFPVKKPVYRRSTCAFARHSLKAVEVAIEVNAWCKANGKHIKNVRDAFFGR